MVEKIRSVAIIGAGASGAITAAALTAEGVFERVSVFERREHGIYDPEPPQHLPLHPGAYPPDIDPPVPLPNAFPKITAPNQQERFERAPVYKSLTTNVPAIAMSFSDIPFAYGPFVPHHVAKQYVEGYFSAHRLDSKEQLHLNTTVEDLSLLRREGRESWKLTLRKYDAVRHIDIWWEEVFDAVVLANGHYSVPYIPQVPGLRKYLQLFPNKVVHSKTYRVPSIYANKRVLIIGNSASGHDITTELLASANLPIYQSRCSSARWDGAAPPPNIIWKPVITAFLPSGRIEFADGSHLVAIDVVIYCTGYRPSFPFWNTPANGRPLWSYAENRLRGTYLHTFFRDSASLAIVGLPRALSFRSWEYQAVAVARLWAGRSAAGLPSLLAMGQWEVAREQEVEREGGRFHDVAWLRGDSGRGPLEWFAQLSGIAGLGLLTGEGRNPPRLEREVRWAIEHVSKYPVRDGNANLVSVGEGDGEGQREWVVIDGGKGENLLGFI